MSERARAAVPMTGARQDCLPAQRRYWLLDRIDPGNPALNIAVRWRLEGRMSTAELQQAFARIIARHPALRTGIHEHEGAPARVVEPSVAFRVHAVDLTAVADGAALEEAGRLAQADARAAFDLAQPPLIRVTHLRLREDLAIVLLAAHRVICDEISVAILARELGQACAALSGAHVPEAPPADGVAAAPAPPQSGEARRRDEDYWTRVLHGLDYFEVPTDYPRPPVLTSNGQIVSARVAPPLVPALLDLARRHDTTLFAVTLAALFALLQRHSGESDVAVGSPVARSDARGLRDAVGQFANMSVLRADLAGDPPFTELLAQVRHTVAEGLKHADTPLERVIELLGPKRDLGRNALFSITWDVHEARVGGNYGRFRLVALPPCSAGVACDLAFLLAEQQDGWHASCEFNTDLFEPQTVRRLLRHFVRLLGAVVDDPGQRLSALPLLDDAERQALLADGERTATAYPDLPLPQLFGAQARRAPGAVAVACGDARLGYGALEAAANRLAHELRQRGIARGSLVGICLERSPDLVVALLAVLKAGAAYVPLDPGYPPARLAQIVGDARPAAVLTSRAVEGCLPDGAATLILLDAEAERIARHPDTPPGPAPAPDDLAYVIYTSGSTGRPKGVQVRHRGLTNLLWAMRSAPGLAADDSLLAVTTVSFDIAALELFLPLVVGARVVLAREAEAGDGAALWRLLRRHGVTVLQATPVTWQILLAAGWTGDPPLKMLCGGEALARALADRLLATGGELWNLYGPTETTIWSSAQRVEPGAGAVPIGPPVANTQFYVVDANGGLAPPGAPGELCIGGDGVAAGYLNLPEMTRERFVPDRFRARAGAKLYRTGDRVRRRAQGGFEFLGRGDRQIKLRGFRIELGEVEAALRAHPQVTDAVAIVGPDASGEDALRACVAAPGAPATLGAELRGRLRQVLPGYMCPATVVVLADLPRTPNGKVDRKALPPPAPVAPSPGGLHRPVSDLEQRLARLWSEVLGVSGVDVDANFFEIGGHSLLAVRLLVRIEAAFGCTLSLAALFRHPTVAGQARLLEHGDPRAFDFRQVVQLQAGGSRPPLIALNNTGIFYGLSKHLGTDQPFTSLQLFDPTRPQAALPGTLEDIAAEYARLIRRVQPAGPYALLGWCVAGTLAFEVARQLRAGGETVSRLILFDTLAPGHLRRLSWPRALLAGYAYRWQLIAADWRRTRLAPRRLRAFLGNRLAVRALLRLFRLRAPETAPAPAGGAPLSAEQYDQWLLRYLEEAAAAYEPRPYPGAMTLFRSSQEPAGRFLDPLMGWGGFVGGGIDLVVVDGDHFSIFQEPGVSHVARRIEAGVAAFARPAAPALD